jgi:hypothetical protein
MYTVKKNDKESYYGVYLNGKKNKKKGKIENYISWGLKKKKQTN